VLAIGASAACPPYPATRCQQDGDCPKTAHCDVHGGFCVDGSARANFCTDVNQAALPPGLYRSVGPERTVPVVESHGNGLTIAGALATFAQPLPDDVGLGDVIQYDGNDDGVVDELAFIHGRVSATQFVVANRLTLTPAPTRAADQDWSICRAYLSMARALAGDENLCVALPLRNFDDWDAAPGRDLVVRGTSLHLAGYGDGADVEPLAIEGWTTDRDHYVRLFTPTGSCQVGRSQRHRGVWSDAAYRLTTQSPGCCHGELVVAIDWAVIEGLQFAATYIDGYNSNIGISSADTPSDKEVRISHNLLIGDDLAGASGNAIIRIGRAHVVKAWNNAILCRGAASDRLTGVGMDETSTGKLVDLYQNTVVGCGTGFYLLDVSVLNTVRNNLAAFNGTDYSGAGTPYDNTAANVSTDDSSPNPEFRGRSVRFVDVSGGNLHLADNDTVARDQGVDLSQDFNIPVHDDIDGDPRPRGGGFDIGADEAR